MKIKTLSNDTDIEEYLKRLNVDSGGVKILSSKHERYLIELENLHVGAANILKQDALSVGADLAVPRGTVTAEHKKVDALLIATRRQLQKLLPKEKAQPFGLKQLSAYIEQLLYTTRKAPKIMGIVNANDDSFYSGSRFVGDSAIAMIERMIKEGADIIDIGAVSSRPGAECVDADEELKRIRPIADALYERKIYEKVRLSIDSYAPKVIEYVLKRGFQIVNDITGLTSDTICELVAKYDAQAVIMHMQGTPQTMQKAPHYDDVVEEVYAFFQERIQKAKSFGIEDVVLDIGIGFGKNVEHNLELLRYISHFKTLHKPLLVGASRKSMIDMVSPSSVEERLPGTLMIHSKAVEEGAEIVRVHDVKEHKQAFALWRALQG